MLALWVICKVCLLDWQLRYICCVITQMQEHNNVVDVEIGRKIEKKFCENV